jgi:hypothetical protein
MKTILVVAGTLGLFTAPAVAGNSKNKSREPARPVLAIAADKVAVAEAGKVGGDAGSGPVAATQEPATVGAPSEPAKVAAPPAPESLDIPVLPPDTSSPLQPFSELERRPVAPAKPAKPIKDKPIVMKMGDDYVLGRRQAGKPEREVEQIIPRSLSQAQVATVVQSHVHDIQNCWELVPKAQRGDASTALLQLSISDAGAVTDIELGGDVPAAAHACIMSAVTRWTFPVAETKSEVEYGISLRSL